MSDELLADLERARSIAVSLEQELAAVAAERDYAEATIRGLGALLAQREWRKPADWEPDALIVDPGDVVGEESLPCGDPWAELADGPWDGD